MKISSLRKKIASFLLSLTVLASSLTFVLNRGNDNKAIEVDAAEVTVNFGQLYDFLLDKNEHYTYSDNYIRQYQQSSGGYIDLWKSLGRTVDKANCEPNQYWHFYESWCKPSIDAGTLKFSASGTRGYSNFLCPELVLWIIEACGVSEEKVINAYNAAIKGKQDGLTVSTICKNIRSCVPWSDINSIVLANLPSTPKYHVSPAVDKESVTPQFTMSKFDYDGYSVGESVNFSVTVNDVTKEISSVSGTNVSISVKDDVYSFPMPSNHVDLSVTLKTKGGGDTPIVTGDGYKLVTSLNELIDGANVIIGTPGSFKRNAAISLTQNANNRSSITMVYDNGYYSVSTSPAQSVELCVFTISSVLYNEKTYYQFYDATNKGYLYICSNSNNYLRTQATNNVNGYFEITNNGGVMNIVASASSYSRNTIGNYSSSFIGCAGGTTVTTVDLAIYSDVSATTKTWANTYLKMNDPSFSGLGEGNCISKGYYETAKAKLTDMGIAYINMLRTSNDTQLSSALARYEAWARANNDNDPYDGLVSYVSPFGTNIVTLNNQKLIIAFIFVFSSVLSIVFICSRHKKKRID